MNRTHTSPETLTPASPSTDRFLPLVAVETITGLSRSLIRTLIHAGEFPSPYQLTKRRVGWRLSEVISWMESRRRLN